MDCPINELEQHCFNHPQNFETINYLPRRDVSEECQELSTEHDVGNHLMQDVGRKHPSREQLSR